MSFWKNLGIFNFLTGKTTEERIIGLGLVMMEEEKEKKKENRKNVNLNNRRILTSKEEDFIIESNNIIGRYMHSRKKYLTNEEIEVLKKYQKKIHEVEIFEIPNINKEAQEYMDSIDRRIVDNK